MSNILCLWIHSGEDQTGGMYITGYDQLGLENRTGRGLQSTGRCKGLEEKKHMYIPRIRIQRYVSTSGEGQMGRTTVATCGGLPLLL